MHSTRRSEYSKFHGRRLARAFHPAASLETKLATPSRQIRPRAGLLRSESNATAAAMDRLQCPPALAAMRSMAAEERKPNALLATLGNALEAVLNRALALDAEVQARLAGLEGRRVGIELSGTPLALAIRASGGRLRVGPHRETASDLNLRASPGSLLAFALRRGEGSPLPSGKVEISGDAELARSVEKLARDFRPDIEEAFARTFGDVIGVPLARALHAGLTWSRESLRAGLRDSADFLRDDSRDLVAPPEMDEFLDAVDALRERVDRLGARIANLTAWRPGEPG
jgi:ubiquinone biosynthesis accessory factor UbiJ